MAFLTACASNRGPGMSAQTLAPGVSLTLPDDPPFAGPVGATQLVQARYRERHEMFQSTIEASSEHFIVAMTVPSGPGIMRLDWRHRSISAKKESIAPDNLTPERMLADLMLVYAPDDVLRAALAGGNVVIAGESTRTLFKDGRAVVKVTRPSGDLWNGHATLVNYAYDYALDIQSRRVSP